MSLADPYDFYSLKYKTKYLAVADIMVQLRLDRMDIIVDHGQSDTDGKHRDDGKGDGRVGDEAVGLDSTLQVHLQLVSIRLRSLYLSRMNSLNAV